MEKTKLINFETDVHTTKVDWLWEPYIPYGKITIIQGDPGCGKTMLAAYLISKLSNGESFVNNRIVREPIVSLYQTGEDGLGDTIKPRLEKFKANCELIYSIDDYCDSLSMSDDRIEKAIIETGARVIVLDPIQAYLGAKVDMHRANEVRPVLKYIGDVAERHQCAVILIGHMNKSGAKAQYRGIGSIDFLACARSVLTMGVINEEPNIRPLIQTKNSLGTMGSSIAFEMSEEKCFSYIGDYEITAEQLLDGASGSSKMEAAKKIIIENVSNVMVESKKILELAKEQGISERTMKSAKEAMNVQSVKIGNIWHWVRV